MKKNSKFTAYPLVAESLPEALTFGSIPQMPSARYNVDVDWDDVERHIQRYIDNFRFDMNPEFQREHVWKREQ